MQLVVVFIACVALHHHQALAAPSVLCFSNSN